MTTDLVKRLRSRESISQLNPGRAVALCEEAAAEIERLRGENEVTAADLHAWMKLKAAAEARLAGAVEWVREARKFCQDGLAGDGCTPQQALERIHEASGDIIAKLEGRSYAIRAMEEKP